MPRVVVINHLTLDGARTRDQRLHLVVKDIDDARQALIASGVDVGEIDDPEGNSWALQEMVWRSDSWD